MAARTMVDLNLLKDTVRLPTLYREAPETRKLIIDTTRTDGNIGIVFTGGELTDFTSESDWVLLIPTAQLQAAVIA